MPKAGVLGYYCAAPDFQLEQIGTPAKQRASRAGNQGERNFARRLSIARLQAAIPSFANEGLLSFLC
jgi:hypothetical protein